MNTKVLNQNSHIITTIAIGLLLCGIASYMYFLSLSVMHVVMRKEATHNVNELRSEIAKLEAAYIEARHNISMKVATVDGFENNQNKIFISKAEQNLVLNSRTE